MEKYYQYCLQGNVRSAYEYLTNMEKRTTEEQQLLDYYESIFFSDKASYSINHEDVWIRNVINAYYHYFIDVLTNKLIIAEAENKLLRTLNTLIEGNYGNLDEIEEKLETVFTQKGYYFLGGITQPFHGPYIWKSIEKKVYEVDLPFSNQSVTVYFMEDFLMLSWLHFATNGKKSTAGWAKVDGLYCVRNRYDLNSSTFQVSFLKHEAQHFNDFEKFPHLLSWELEYRAKLIELIYGDSVTLLKKFTEEAINDTSFPHLYAAFKIKEFYTQLAAKALNKEIISCYALELYKKHTASIT